MYTDEGITGTSTKRREGFKRMIADALDGRIEIFLSKWIQCSGRIKCGDCGGWYGSKVWHSPEKCKRTVWQCNQKYKNEVRCTTPYLDEASVKERFTVAVNQLLAGRYAAIAAYEQGMARTLDTTALETQQEELLSEMEVLNGMIQQMIRQNATVAQDQTEYAKDDLRFMLPCEVEIEA